MIDEALDIPEFLKLPAEQRAAGWKNSPPRDMVTGSTEKRDWRRPKSMTDAEWQEVLDAEAKTSAAKAAEKRLADEARREAKRAEKAEIEGVKAAAVKAQKESAI